MKENKVKDISDGEKELLRLIVEVSNGIWRANNKLESSDLKKNDNDVKMGLKHLKSILSILQREGFEIKDYDNESYDIGMALDVLTFQSVPDIKNEKIMETIKPTIYYNNKIIQRGQVIVAKPDK